MFWARVLNPAFKLESYRELLKDADTLDLLHCKWIIIVDLYFTSYSLCPKAFSPNIQRPGLRTPVASGLIHCTFCTLKTHKTYLKLQTFPLNSRLPYPNTLSTSPLVQIMGISNSMYSKPNMTFLHEPNPMLPIVFSSQLTATTYFQLLRPINLESSLIPVFHTKVSFFSKSCSAFKIQPNATSRHLHHCHPDPILLPPTWITAIVSRQVSLFWTLCTCSPLSAQKAKWCLKMVSQIVSAICS